MSNRLPLLPDDHPAASTLRRICAQHEGALADYHAMEEAGFRWPEGARPPRLYWQRTTLLHPELPGYSVTTYPAKGSSPIWDKMQRDAYANQIHRDEKIAALIAERDWRDLTVVKRWLFPLDEEGRRYALVAEELPRLPYQLNLDAHWQMSEEVLSQLIDCIVALEVPFGGPLTMNFLTTGRVLLAINSNLRKGLGHFATRFLPYLRPELQPVARKRWTYALRVKEAEWPPCTLASDLLERAVPLLLPTDHPAVKGLERIDFKLSDFADRGSLREGGFRLVEGSKRVHHDQIMVAGHPELSGYLLKSYPLLGDKISPYRRLLEYCVRCEKAAVVRHYIAEQRCRYLTVPSKWIYWLGSRSVSRRATAGYYLLIVEEMDLLSEEEAEVWYRTHCDGWVEEVLRLYLAMGGLDCNPENLPVTRDGKIALLDTEHVGWGHAERFPACFPKMIGQENKEQAEAIWHRLQEERR